VPGQLHGAHVPERGAGLGERRPASRHDGDAAAGRSVHAARKLASPRARGQIVFPVEPTFSAVTRRANLAALERDISRVNFFRNKAKNIKLACQLLVDRFGGEVPSRMEDLLQLPGVARKTANVVLGNAFRVEAGIVVDTHVMRLSQRLGLSAQRDRDKIEQDLMALVPRERWTRFGHQMIAHGRAICTAKAPKCLECPIGKLLCPAYQV